MYVNRMRLLNVKSLHGDIPENGGALPQPTRRRLLLLGANGSGKTTVLETILALWKFWGEWLEEGEGEWPNSLPRVSSPSAEHLNHYLAKAGLAAIEIVDIPNSKPLWIGLAGSYDDWHDLQRQHPDAVFAGLIHSPAGCKIELPPGDWLSLRHRSLADSETFPNVVFFPPEGRTIRPPENPRGEIIDTTQFNWTAVYDPTLSLDSVLLTVKALSPDRFEECLWLTNLALDHQRKRITGFGPKGRLVVKGATKSGTSYEHPIEALSSGERQMLLLAAFVVAFLRPGGIVLLDEPDLHIHMSMVAQLLETLERAVHERHGQLIVTSHAELVSDWFARQEEQINLSPWRGGNP